MSEEGSKEKKSGPEWKAQQLNVKTQGTEGECRTERRNTKQQLAPKATGTQRGKTETKNEHWKSGRSNGKRTARSCRGTEDSRTWLSGGTVLNRKSKVTKEGKRHAKRPGQEAKMRVKAQVTKGGQKGRKRITIK